MKKLMAAIAALLFLAALAKPAEARRHHGYSVQFQEFCGDRYCGGVSYTEKKTQRVATRRTARRAAAVRPDANDNDAIPAATRSGRVCSHKTGACASVSGRATAPMQAMANDLEQNYGSILYYLGGARKGTCSLGHQHMCWEAVDFCQMRRGVVDPKCKLPDPVTFNKIARKHYLHEGSVWCNGDYGHVQFRYSGGCNRTAHGYGGMLPTITGKMVATIAASRNDEARAFTDRAEYVEPKPPREEFSAVKADKPKKKRFAARSHKRKYAHRHYHHRVRVAQG